MEGQYLGAELQRRRNILFTSAASLPPACWVYRYLCSMNFCLRCPASVLFDHTARSESYILDSVCCHGNDLAIANMVL